MLWPSVSGGFPGHLRDFFIVLRTFRSDQPVFAVPHRGSFDTLFRAPATMVTARRLTRRINGIVFLSKRLSERCARWVPPEQRFVIPNTIDEALLCTDVEMAAKQRGRQARSMLRLLYLSRMDPHKGYMNVLNAASMLHRCGISVQVTFAGRWHAETDRPAFEEAVRKNELQDVVKHHGGLSRRDDIRTLHLCADAFLLPTFMSREAQPPSIIEALNAGTPVITTLHGGIPDTVRDREAQIAEAVQHLIDFGTWKGYSARARFK